MKLSRFNLFSGPRKAIALARLSLQLPPRSPCGAPWRSQPGGAISLVSNLVEPRVLERDFSLPVPPPPSVRSGSDGSPRVAASPDKPEAIVGSAGQPRTDELIPTYGWVNAFSMSSTLDGEPVPARRRLVNLGDRGGGVHVGDAAPAAGAELAPGRPGGGPGDATGTDCGDGAAGSDDKPVVRVRGV